MTTRVNCITKFINNFRMNGRTANSIIYQADGNPVWQRVNKDGSIGLKISYVDEDVFTLITDKNIIEKVIKTNKNDNTKIWKSAKTYWVRTGRMFSKASTHMQEKLFINGALEEEAFLTRMLNGPVSYFVKSASNRTTEFPKTSIAKNMRPAVIRELKHIDGSTTYIEHHQFN